MKKLVSISLLFVIFICFGTFSYSGERKDNKKDSIIRKIYPLPANSQVTIVLNKIDAKSLKVVISNILGDFDNQILNKF